jgi:amylosucrase
MYNQKLHTHINAVLKENKIDISGKDNLFYTRVIANAAHIHELYMQLYAHHAKGEETFDKLVQTIINAYKNRADVLKKRDEEKQLSDNWFLSNEITGMSLYVDRFCGNLQHLQDKLAYLERLGVNLLHLMPVFESPAGQSDGGYAVSNFRKVEHRFGSLEDLQALQQKMLNSNMYLMLDIVLNHTSQHHEWAEKAKRGDTYYQDYYYFYDNRNTPDEFDRTMPDIFPESAPGNFTYVEEVDKWVMTVFHNYQWDLNYTNPLVFVDMLDTIFFYANLGVDILRIDAPAFIWKQLGTASQNLHEAHTILRLIKLCVQAAAPGMALLGEAIVAPTEIMRYFGTGNYKAHECDFAYNATHMALQWDMLATGDTRVMLAAQHELLQKPYGTSWITYTRCHDDIGLGYDDSAIEHAGFNAWQHKKFLKEYYSGTYPDSPSAGALFSVNPKTQDARISGSLAALCGLEKALNANDANAIEISVQKILLMQAHSFFLGGVPMIFYGDETAHINDYSYKNDAGKSYDNRWMHRPQIDWKKNENIDKNGTIEHTIFSATQKLISIRKKLDVFADKKNLIWITPHNIHVAGYLRTSEAKRVYCIFNFSNQPRYLTWYAFREHGNDPRKLYDHWEEKTFEPGKDHEYLTIKPYGFHLLEPI